MEPLLQDFRHALRQLARAPGFTAAAVLTLALGIGANTAVFSVVNAVLLRPLPFPEPGDLVQVLATSPLSEGPALSPPDFLDMQERNRTLEALGGFDNTAYTLTGQGEPLRLVGAQVSASFFPAVGMPPAMGRGFTDEENEPGRNQVVVLGHGLWQDVFGRDPEVVGRSIRLNDVEHTVVGVMPPGFRFWEWSLLTPLAYSDEFRGGRGAVYLQAIGRTAPGVTAEQASQDLGRIARELEEEYPGTNTGRGARAVPLQEFVTGDVRPALLVLLGAVGLVLLIACANVANLVLARGSARAGEFAVRSALGADGWRLARQLLTESIVLAGAGAALGLALAGMGTAALVGALPGGLPGTDGLPLDRTVVGFALAMGLFTGILFGVAPSLRVSRASLAESLRVAGWTNAGSGGGRLRAGLVVGQVALAVMLLSSAGLLIRSFEELRKVELGFDVDRVLALGVALPSARYPEDPQRVQFFEEFLGRVESLPGVVGAGAVLAAPMSGADLQITFDVAGREVAPPGLEPVIQVRIASPGYLSALGIPVRTGRGFTSSDRADAPRVVLLNEAAVREHFPGGNPMGQRIELGWFRDGEQVGGEVVGVVGDIRQFGPGEAFVPEIYLPYAQVPQTGMTIVVRTEGAPTEVVGQLRSELAELDPNLPVSNVRTLEQVSANAVAEPRFMMLLVSLFAGLALALSSIGIFGVVSYSVARRTGEFGIRLALGARGSDVLGLVLRGGGFLVLAGLSLGMMGALASGRILESLLFGVSVRDPVVLVLVPLVLTGVALVACLLPARRATRVDPMIALRAE